MRGKDYCQFFLLVVRGITPAHAGKRSSFPRSQRSTKDHPRPCGEKIRPVAFSVFLLGSPPPMRGKEDLTNKEFAAVRITPAHAGKSFLTLLPSLKEKDHPRPCGEKLSHQSITSSGVGSPPPMRGKGDARLETTDDLGITPAHAGKSMSKNR